MTPPLTFGPLLHCNPSTLSQERPLRRGGRSPCAPKLAGVTGACGFINKYLSVCCSNEQGSNLKWSEQPPGMQTSRTGCSRQSNVKVHQRGIPGLLTPIHTDTVTAWGRGWIPAVVMWQVRWVSCAPLWTESVTSGLVSLVSQVHRNRKVFCFFVFFLFLFFY